MKKMVVITGGNGDIAKAIAKKLRKDYCVLTPDKQQLDVTNMCSIYNFFRTYNADILINNAGFILPQKINDLDLYTLQKHIDVNLIGSIFCTKYAILNGAKFIINIGSSAGCVGKAGWLAYCVSKAGLIMFTDCLNKEGVHSIILNIGRTDTKMRRNLFPNEDKSTLLNVDNIAKLIYDILRAEKDYNYWNIKMYKKDGEICIEMV
jgi:NAD(P)-dependent dehydrogenase (short-subunit alcohol dehydrogenase family)